MFWIDGIARTSSGFALRTRTAGAAAKLQPVSLLGTKLATDAKTHRTRLTTTCSSWVKHSPTPFLNMLGLADHPTESNHSVFLLRDDDKQYLVPASVLLGALMRPIQHIHPYLLRPHGLDVFSTPIVGAEPSIGLNFPKHRVFGEGRRPSTGLLASYAWMHCFPSARAMWDSVYEAATKGHVDIALPDATFVMTLHSIPMDEWHLVTGAVVMTVEAHDNPFEFAADVQRHFALHDGAAIDWQECHKPKSSISPRGAEWGLSDMEWAAISAELQLKPRIKYEARQIIDLIITKLGSGKPWKRLDYGGLNFPIVQTTYQRMQKSGRWEKLEHMLSDLRKPLRAT